MQHFFWGGNLGLINHYSLCQFYKDQENIQYIYKDQGVLQQGSGGHSTRIRGLLAGFFGIGATIRIGQEIFVSCMRDFSSSCPFQEGQEIGNGSYHQIVQFQYFQIILCLLF